MLERTSSLGRLAAHCWAYVQLQPSRNQGRWEQRGGCKQLVQAVYLDVLKYIYIYSRGRKKEKKEGLATRTFWGFACAQTGGRVLPRGRWKEKCIEGWVYCIYLR